MSPKEAEAHYCEQAILPGNKSTNATTQNYKASAGVQRDNIDSSSVIICLLLSYQWKLNCKFYRTAVYIVHVICTLPTYP